MAARFSSGGDSPDFEAGCEFIGHTDEELQPTTVKILVSGKSGSGKTTLISGIVGVELPKRQGELSEWHKQLSEDVAVTVWDTPGLLDGTDSLNQEGYLQQMQEECSVRDLSIYCIKISDARFVHSTNNPDVVAMKKLTDTFGLKFWKDCVIVLTYANILPAINVHWKRLPPNEKNIQFQSKIQEWQEEVRKILVQDIQVSDETVQKIKIVPAGHYEQPHLPGIDYWFSNLWFTCTDAIRSPDVRQALVKANHSRMKSIKEVKVDDFNLPIEVQPIVTMHLGSINYEILEGGILGGLAGGTIGLVGLVAGPPTVTITLPAGVVVGAVMGIYGTASGRIPINKFKEYLLKKAAG